MKPRIYIHGDEVAGNSGSFYCAKCDIFDNMQHFSYHLLEENEDKYASSYKNLRYRKKLHLRSKVPNNPFSYVDLKKSDYYRWLKRQTGRNDKVGQMANQIISDPNFPSHKSSLISYVKYLKSTMTSKTILYTMESAYQEFVHR